MRKASLLFVLFSGIVLHAQTLPGIAPTNGPTKSEGAKEYPQEAVVVEELFRSFRFENDGSGTTKTRVKYDVQSEAGVQQVGVLQLSYNSISDEVKIDYVRVRKPDGTVINTPVESAQEATSNVSQMAPMYTDMKIRYLPVVGLRPGDTLEFEYATTVKKPIVWGQFFMEASFEKDAITRDEVIELDIPASRVPILMREGAITSVFERGVNENEGEFRLTFFYRNRRARLGMDPTGRIIRRSTIDFGDRPIPDALHQPGG